MSDDRTRLRIGPGRCAKCGMEFRGDWAAQRRHRRNGCHNEALIERMIEAKRANSGGGAIAGEIVAPEAAQKEGVMRP